MKNLIEEIERVIQALKAERQKCFEEIDYPLSQVDKLEGRILAYEDVLNVFKDYNIIAAPKSIKLSEIIEKLREEQNDYVFRYDDDSSISVWKNNWCYGIATICDDTLKLDFDIHDRYLFPRWMFALWIAETEIVDDLKEEE